MQVKNNKTNEDLYASVEIKELTGETPIGWSATCLDQTICYYLNFDQEYSEESDSSNPT